MTIKDLGPEVLNLVLDLENNEPWEYDDGPSFGKLDDELKDAKASGDFLVNTKMLLPVGNTQELAWVLHLKCNPDANPVGSAHGNPALDTCMYEVHFSDGRTEELAANAILRLFIPNVMLMAISMSCWMPSWITARIHPWLCPRMTR